MPRPDAGERISRRIASPGCAPRSARVGPCRRCIFAEHACDGRGRGFCLDLPLEPADPLERLDSIRRATAVRKQGHDAQQLDALTRELARVPPLRRFAERALAHPRSFALNVSNVPGPRRPVEVLGVPVRALYSLAEIREHHALRISVVSLANALSFGLTADPTLLTDIDTLARDTSCGHTSTSRWCSCAAARAPTRTRTPCCSKTPDLPPRQVVDEDLATARVVHVVADRLHDPPADDDRTVPVSA